MTTVCVLFSRVNSLTPAQLKHSNMKSWVIVTQGTKPIASNPYMSGKEMSKISKFT